MKSVVIVEDSQFMRNLYDAILEDQPVEIVAESQNGVAGVDAYKEHEPDLVVMNVRMPILDGIGATEQITEYDPDATIVICTGNRQEKKMREAVQAGADDYITKPFQRDHFLSAILDALES